MRMFRTGMVAMIALGVSWAQQFEVASVKMSGPKSVRGVEGGPGTRDPGRYSFTSATMLDLIVAAYGVEGFQVAGKIPLDREHYDVETRMPSSTTRGQFQAMLRELLTERFHLKQHIESKEFPAYELVVGKSGFKPTPADAKGPGFPELPEGRPGMSAQFTPAGSYSVVRMRARQKTMADLSNHLHQSLDRPVVDRTGVSGTYDYTLEYANERGAPVGDRVPEPATAPTIFAAVQKQLGLQLVAKKIAFDVVTVEAFDKTPTGN